MSVPVSIDDLRAETERRRRAPYLITVSPDGRPHAVAVPVGWEDGDLVAAPGNRTASNAAARPSVSVLWPADDPDGYSLIVDATVTAAHVPDDAGNRLVLTPTHAVLHRPAAPADAAEGCTADCRPIPSRPDPERPGS